MGYYTLLFDHRNGNMASADSVQVVNADCVAPERGKISVTFTVQPTKDARAYGHTLLFPDLSPEDLKGFPIAEAVVQSEGKGYASMYGWVQLFRQTPSPSEDISNTEWEFDDLPFTRGLNLPFSWYGSEPKLFDGPLRGPEVSELNWSSRSFLTYIRGDVTSRTVVPLLGFEWGFTRTKRQVSMKKLESLKVDAWEEYIPLLTDMFDGWNFAKAPAVQVRYANQDPPVIDQSSAPLCATAAVALAPQSEAAVMSGTASEKI